MRKILYLWMICVVLCSLVSCNDSDDKTYSSYVSRFVWENRCNHRIEYFYVEGCITRSQGIKYGERAVKELEGPSPVDLQTFLDGRETHVIYDSFTEGVIIYCYMENYYPSGLGEVAVPKSLQDPDRYVYKAYEEGDKYVVGMDLYIYRCGLRGCQGSRTGAHRNCLIHNRKIEENPGLNLSSVRGFLIRSLRRRLTIAVRPKRFRYSVRCSRPMFRVLRPGPRPCGARAATGRGLLHAAGGCPATSARARRHRFRHRPAACCRAHRRGPAHRRCHLGLR